MQISYKNAITYTVIFTEEEFNQLTDAVAEGGDSLPATNMTDAQKAAVVLCRDMWAQKRETQSS